MQSISGNALNSIRLPWQRVAPTRRSSHVNAHEETGTGGVREFLNPFEMMRRKFEETMSNFWPEGEFALTRGALPMVDVWETDGDVEINLDLPGVKPEEIKVEVRGNDVLIHGEWKQEEEKDDKRNFHRMERRRANSPEP